MALAGEGELGGVWKDLAAEVAVFLLFYYEGVFEDFGVERVLVGLGGV